MFMKRSHLATYCKTGTGLFGGRTNWEIRDGEIWSGARGFNHIGNCRVGGIAAVPSRSGMGRMAGRLGRRPNWPNQRPCHVRRNYLSRVRKEKVR
jgi:hypothetical protein